MVVVPLSKPTEMPSQAQGAVSAPGKSQSQAPGAVSAPSQAQLARRGPEPNWLRYAAAGTLAAGGVLLVTGNKRVGLVVAASGAALAMLDQQEAVSAWWNMLPGFLEEMSATLGKAQSAVQDLSTQGQKLREMLHCG
jgi:hypothetical protein